MNKVYGDRTCPICRGIVHDESYRTKIGTRRKYFDTKQCVTNYLKSKYPQVEIADIETLIPSFVEKVEVVTK